MSLPYLRTWREKVSKKSEKGKNATHFQNPKFDFRLAEKLFEFGTFFFVFFDI